MDEHKGILIPSFRPELSQHSTSTHKHHLYTQTLSLQAIKFIKYSINLEASLIGHPHRRFTILPSSIKSTWTLIGYSYFLPVVSNQATDSPRTISPHSKCLPTFDIPPRPPPPRLHKFPAVPSRPHLRRSRRCLSPSLTISPTLHEASFQGRLLRQTTTSACSSAMPIFSMV